MSRRRRPRPGFSEPDVRDETVFIYGLCEPSTGAVRYIGKSSNPEARLQYHCCANAVSLRMWHWVRKLRAQGLKPTLQILRVVEPGSDCAAAELAVIECYSRSGADLINFHGVPNRGRRLSVDSDDPLILELIEMGHPWTSHRRRGFSSRRDARIWANNRTAE